MTYAPSAARRSASASRSPRRAKYSGISTGLVAIAAASLLVPCVVFAGSYLVSTPFGAGSGAWAAVAMQVETPADAPARRGDRLRTRNVTIEVPQPVMANAAVTGSLGAADVTRCGGDRIARETLDFLYPPRVAIS